MSIGQALYLTVCPVVFQKHQPDSLRVCPSCLWSSLSSADSQDYCAPPWTQLTVAKQGLGSGAAKRNGKCSKGLWGFGTRRKREGLLLLKSTVRERGKEAPDPFRIIVNPTILHAGLSSTTTAPFFTHSYHTTVLFAMSAFPDLFSQLCLMPSNSLSTSFLPPTSLHHLKLHSLRIGLFNYMTS